MQVQATVISTIIIDYPDRLLLNSILRMLKLGIAISVVAFAAAQEHENDHPINEEIVAAIRLNNADWEAWDPSENPLRHLTMEEIKGMLGLPPV